MRAFLAAAVIATAASLAATSGHATQPLPPNSPEQASEVRIDGFRSAHFGMTEAAVRQAIADDFHLSGAAVISAENPVERTAVLRIRTADLIPDGGSAQIDYIFGYRSHALIEVNILWSAATDAKITPALLVTNGATLQAYFEKQAFAPDQTTTSGILPDGTVLLFRTRDAAGHAIVLVLAGRRANLTKDTSAQLTPTVLSLVYAVDPAHPDVFQLKKGSF